MLYHHLAYCGVGLSQFKEFAESTTVKIKAAAYQAAAIAGRPLKYLGNKQLSKEDLVRELAQRDKIREGLMFDRNLQCGRTSSGRDCGLDFRHSAREMGSPDNGSPLPMLT
jgi:hypothetical protein